MISKRRKISNEKEKPEDEKPVEQTDYSVYFKGIFIPIEILVTILSYLRSNRSLLINFGFTNKSMYFQARLNWKEIVKVTKNNILKIPTVVLKGTEKIWFSESFNKSSFLRIISDLSPEKLTYLSFKATHVTKSSSRNQFYLSIIKKNKFIFPKCRHLCLCYGVRENTSGILWDFSSQLPNITRLESPTIPNESLISQLPNLKEILHGMTFSEVDTFLTMMASKYPQLSDKITFFNKNFVRDARTAFEVSRYGKESPYKSVWGARQLKEPSTFPPHLKKTVEVFPNLEKLDMIYTYKAQYWDKEGLSSGEKVPYRISEEIVSISNLKNLKYLYLKTSYDPETITCSFPSTFLEGSFNFVQHIKFTSIPYSLYFDHLVPRLASNRWKRLRIVEISFTTHDYSDFITVSKSTDGFTGEDIFDPQNLTEKFRTSLDEMMIKKDFPEKLERITIAFSSYFGIVFLPRPYKNKKVVTFRMCGNHTINMQIQWENGIEKMIFNHLMNEKNVRDESNEEIILEMDEAMKESVLGKYVKIPENLREFITVRSVDWR